MPTRFVPENAYLLNRVKVKCDNKKIDLEEAESYIKQKPNKHILYVFRFHLMVYNIAHLGKERKWKTKLGTIVGEEPVIFEQVKTDKSCKQITSYFKNKGYYHAVVTDSIKLKRKKTNVTYIISTGNPYKISQIKYKIDDKRLFDLIYSDSSASLLKSGNLLDADVLQKERVRIAEKLKSNGYYYFAKEYVFFDADTSIGNYNVNLTTIIQDNDKQLSDGTLVKEPHKQYTLDSVFFYTDFDPKLAIQEREKYFNLLDTMSYKGYSFIYNNKIEIKPKVLVRSCFLNSDEVYSQKDVDRTYRNLTSLKTFRLVNIQFFESQKPNKLNCYLQLTPLSRQSYKLEAEGTNSSGNLGVAGNIIYQNRNLFKGAQQFDIKIRGAIERQTAIISQNQDQITEYIPFNTMEIGGESKLSFPTFLMPFSSERFIKRRNPKTNLLIAYNFQQRPDYTRTISNITYGYSWEGNKNLKHFFNPAEINYVNLPFISQRFQNTLRGTFLENSYTNHLTGVTSYGFLFNDPNLGKHHDVIYVRGQLESAGNLLSELNDLFHSETTDGSYQILNTKYAQFVKAETDVRYYHFITKGTKMAYRIFGGIGIPYGNLDVLPFEKRYFCGGASSIRAWPVRDLGPGSYSDSLITFPNQTADIKLEANLEYRFKLVWVIEGALFVDAGNIWDLRKTPERPGAEFRFDKFYNDIAIGYGLGLRLDFSFFIFRLDWGIKGRDPSQPVGQRWLQWHQKFSAADQAINIGIGYPF
jgi:outer membrane protein assembly factor BamA